MICTSCVINTAYFLKTYLIVSTFFNSCSKILHRYMKVRDSKDSPFPIIVDYCVCVMCSTVIVFADRCICAMFTADLQTAMPTVRLKSFI